MIIICSKFYCDLKKTDCDALAPLLFQMLLHYSNVFVVALLLNISLGKLNVWKRVEKTLSYGRVMQ